MFLKEEDYWDAVNHIFSNGLDDNWKNTNVLVDIFKDFPQILNPALTYSLSNIHSCNAIDAKLVVNVLEYIFYNVYDRPDMGIEQRDSIAQPLANFLNSQG